MLFCEVCEGDRLLVDIHNSVLGCTDSIHWHGIHMKNQQYYDGVPYLTQCPIAGNAFRYDFRPDDPGTYWWHSHSGKCRRDVDVNFFQGGRIRTSLEQYLIVL